MIPKLYLAPILIRFLLPLHHSATAHIRFFPIPFLHPPPLPYNNRDSLLARWLLGLCVANMCHPNVPVSSLGNPARPSRWQVSPVTGISSTAEAGVLAREAAPEAGSRGGGVMRQCMCSPTGHAGSFRCRLHIAEYVWGRRCAQ